MKVIKPSVEIMDEFDGLDVIRFASERIESKNSSCI
jgi:hypothetical protein